MKSAIEHFRYHINCLSSVAVAVNTTTPATMKETLKSYVLSFKDDADAIEAKAATGAVGIDGLQVGQSILLIENTRAPGLAGNVFTIRAIDAPFVVARRLTGWYASETPDKLNLSICKWKLADPAYVAAAQEKYPKDH